MKQWTPKLAAFLKAISVMPNITRAAAAAKMNKSHHYEQMRSSPEYAEAFREAFQIGLDAVCDVAVTRATEGWAEPVIHKGKVAREKEPGSGKLVPVTVRRVDNNLLRFLLERRHAEFRPRVE